MPRAETREQSYECEMGVACEFSSLFRVPPRGLAACRALTALVLLVSGSLGNAICKNFVMLKVTPPLVLTALADLPPAVAAQLAECKCADYTYPLLRVRIGVGQTTSLLDNSTLATWVTAHPRDLMARWALAEAYLAARDLAAAAAVLRSFVPAPALYEMGMRQLRLGRDESAINHLEVSVALDERLALAASPAAEILDHRDDPSALAHYESVITLAPTTQLVAAAHTRIASRIAGEGDIAGAEAHLQAALKADPRSWSAEVQMARLAMVRRETNEVCRWTQSSRHHAGDNPWVDSLERDVIREFPQCRLETPIPTGRIPVPRVTPDLGAALIASVPSVLPAARREATRPRTHAHKDRDCPAGLRARVRRCRDRN